MSKKKAKKPTRKEEMKDLLEKEATPEIPISLRDALRVIKNLRQQLHSRTVVSEVIAEKVYEIFQDGAPQIEVPKVPKASRKKREEIAVLHLSDLHFGKHTQTYNSEIAAVRMLELTKRTIKIADIRRSGARIDEIRVYLGGDIVEGERIFEKQVYHIDSGVYQQAVEFTPKVLARCLLLLLENFRKVTVKCVAGNHGRVEPSRKAPRHPLTDWDRVAYKVTQAFMLGDPDIVQSREQKEISKRLTFEIPETWYFVDRVFDWGNLVVHGDQIRGGFAGFPWYGTAKKAWGWNDVIPELERIHGRHGHWDYLWFGHFHTWANFDLNYKTVLANGTLESHNAYAAQELAAAGPACQRLSFFDEEKGLINDNQIYVEQMMPALIRARAPFSGEIVGDEYAGL